jgi:hypothetical protein
MEICNIHGLVTKRNQSEAQHAVIFATIDQHQVHGINKTKKNPLYGLRMEDK